MDPILRLILALLAGAAFGAAAWRAGALSRSGAVAGGLFGAELVAFGGPAWIASAVTFFVLSSALSRVGRARKRTAEALAEKGSQRDAGQVLANGGVGMALLAAFAVAPTELWLWAFVGSVSAAAADTWATEIGTAVGGPTRRLGVGERVPPGTSGGMSAAGTGGALAGAASVAAAAWLVGGVGGGGAVALAAAGWTGALVDTLLGATLQVRYRRPDGSLTERSAEGSQALPRARGVRWLGNDGVNVACTLAGAAGGALAWWGVG